MELVNLAANPRCFVDKQPGHYRWFVDGHKTGNFRIDMECVLEAANNNPAHPAVAKLANSLVSKQTKMIVLLI